MNISIETFVGSVYKTFLVHFISSNHSLDDVGKLYTNCNQWQSFLLYIIKQQM